jgi:hypothetical protein
MTWWARRSVRGSAGYLLLALALTLGACARHAPRPADAMRPAGAATLLPADLALGFVQGIASQPSRSLLAGETTIPPCRFTEKGTWSAGEYRKVTFQRAPTEITGYRSWILFRIEDAGGRDFLPADLERSHPWSYSLRTPISARTVFGTVDHCVVGPTHEPAKKVVEALAALGVTVAQEYRYILP